MLADLFEYGLNGAPSGARLGTSSRSKLSFEPESSSAGDSKKIPNTRARIPAEYVAAAGLENCEYSLKKMP